ncbi:MAG: hypothetical protein EHM90_04525 [Chloroflexi bacterium]|nr:MAG: hypothetical protein EHM90_04525 [Chloroflexota bacterium]
MRVQSHVTISRPAAEVFAVLTDAPTTTRWASATDKAWWVTPPPYGLGAIRRATGTIMGQRFENEATVVEHDPPRREVLSGNQSGVKFQVALDLAPVADGTEVTVTSDIQLSGGMRFLGSMISQQYRQMWDADLATLKRMMEAEEL